MSYQIIFQKSAIKFIRKQDKKTQERLMTAISQLPTGTDIKKMQGHNLYCLRVGNHRILYGIDEAAQKITIENIDNRGDIYKNIRK